MRRLVAALLGGAVVVGLAPAPTSAQAVTTSVTIGGVGITHAADVRTYGAVTTPKVTVSGQAVVSSRSYKIIKGTTTVATSTTQGKRVNLRPGTYTVKSAVRYRTYAESRIKVADEEFWSSSEDRLWDRNKCPISKIRRTSETYDWNGYLVYYGFFLDECGQTWGSESDANKSTYGPLDEWVTGDLYLIDDGAQNGPEPVLWLKPQYKVIRTYSSYKTVQRDVTVTIRNTDTMTLWEYKQIKTGMSVHKVKRIVGSYGNVVRRWSYGKNDYETRVWPSQRYVYFKNGSVYAKVWS